MTNTSESTTTLNLLLIKSLVTKQLGDQFDQIIRNDQSSNTHLLRYNNHHADSLALLALKVDTNVRRAIIIEIKDDPVYIVTPQINAISEVKKILDADIKDT